MENLIKEINLLVKEIRSFFKKIFHRCNHDEVFDYGMLSDGILHERKKCSCGNIKTVIPPLAVKIKKNIKY
ncbi:hypothetical protein COX67_00135 [Candidatus Falkowbacteria bacterium CG_4_10_14_0_2_um_filter_36_22]|uniref:Uncharacterized protein n=1 Tax=Candidatus Falkowbacteria bacterium CG02_land_8_20_14_3_00_36_14 TaxID=1974560 RepID=A0A2M7DQ36_9BACT|nr:MAG: hypothetical protein COS18_01845 [Candidatus Falkowbacteria bacterium CG02_land_8_20_14_3_00_36_14]PIX11537.1 MAG: hypothetical protein COZ73_02345 [Candidatus Falkowbacteria bacterium CG_4_8_14_3_um_filter_36_11]PJA11377.1 MAG: hypothetical protein COX67_00135 [Candidatus Falkowbacteria bacterium CG_4_10_14_0_2_um_filter_36_22]